MKKLSILLMSLVLVGISSLARSQEVSYHSNVVIVVDDSGSMGDPMTDANGREIRKIDAARRALKEVVKTISPETYIGIVSFGRDWLYKLGPRNDVAINAGIDRLSTGGQTPLGRFIKIGADSLLAQRDKQHGYGSYRLLVVTDGEAGDASLVERYTPEIMARGITFDVIGVDMASDHTLANKVNSYRNAKDPESLKQAVAEVLAEAKDNDDGSANTEVFELIAGLPDGIAEKVIGALANSGNQPIGEKPKPKEVKPPEPTNANVDQSQQAASQTAATPEPPSDVPFGLIILGVLAVVVVIIFFAKMLSDC